MSDHDQPAFSGQALKVYNRMLERVESRLAQMDQKTWDALRDSVDEAVEVEAEIQELTQEELDLLAAYVRRDVAHLMHFVGETGGGVGEWLRLDLALIEHQLRDLLFSIADKTQLETLELDHKLHHEQGQYVAGEVAMAGMLKCAACGHMLCLTQTSHIDPCPACSSHYFERVTAHWPHESEVDGKS
jgi:rubrerythrin